MDGKPTKRQLRFASRSPFAAPEMWLMTGILYHFDAKPAR
jgi:hypothetical protein